MLDLRSSPEMLAFLGASDLADDRPARLVTPDHVIRTKNTAGGAVGGAGKPGRIHARPPAVVADEVDRLRRQIRTRETPASSGAKTRLDSLPRVVLVPGVGCA